jgi:hypothetical protein
MVTHHQLHSISCQNCLGFRVSLLVVICQVILRSGTANGGSAILWASIMELSGLESSEIITIDVESPVWNPKADHWGGEVRPTCLTQLCDEDDWLEPMWLSGLLLRLL